MMGSRALLVAAVAAGLGVAAPTPASAAVAECRVNVVCVYNADQSWMGQYSEYTDYFQQITRRDVALAWNRTPASVYFMYSTGVTSCMTADNFADLRIDGYGAVTGIRLSSAGSCY